MIDFNNTLWKAVDRETLIEVLNDRIASCNKQLLDWRSRVLNSPYNALASATQGDLNTMAQAEIVREMVGMLESEQDGAERGESIGTKTDPTIIGRWLLDQLVKHAQYPELSASAMRNVMEQARLSAYATLAGTGWQSFQDMVDDAHYRVERDKQELAQ